MEIREEDGSITGLCLREKIKRTAENWEDTVSFPEPSTPLLSKACRQLTEYFSGKRKVFDLPLDFSYGTEFQKKVWTALCDIPYGETRSYADIAIAAGSPKAVRAVGQANTRNPIMIFVPCHRVINKNGSIGGFGCGVDVKRQLLEVEAVRI